MRTLTLAVLLLAPVLAAHAAEPRTFGRAPDLEKPVSLASAMEAPPSPKGSEVLLEGKVLSSCKKKGCWLVLGDGEKQVRVTFKDYGFFVPKDSAGKRARVQGTLSEEVLSVKSARHFLKDEGASKEEIEKVKAPVKNWAFVASGVQLLD